MEQSHQQTIGRTLDEGVALYRGNWRASYLWSLLICLVTMAFPLLKNIFIDMKMVSLVVFIVAGLLFIWFYLSLIYKLESIHRQKPLSNSEILFYAAGRIPSTLMGMTFYVMAASLSFTPLLLLFVNNNPIFIIVVCLAVAGLSFWSCMALCFFPIGIVSHNLGPLAALTQSWQLMRTVRVWLNATIIVSVGAVMFFVLRILPVLLMVMLFAISQKMTGRSFEMQMLQDPFVNFTWGVAGILLVSQAALTALFQPLIMAVYLKTYHVLEGSQGR